MSNIDNSTKVEQLLTKHYCVIDFLPEQVKAGNGGQFFEVEKFFLSGKQREKLYQKFANTLLKLNCYHDFEVCRCDLDFWDINPSPYDLVFWLLDGEPLCVVLKDADAMISINGDDTHMTLYNPSHELIELTRAIASSEGLFVWEPNPD